MEKDFFYSDEDLRRIGFLEVGKGSKISKKVSFYYPDTITIGDNVRIDDFCILSGNIIIGNNVHISAGVKMYGSEGIEIEDYAGCSANCTIYSASDDFSGDCMVGAVLPDEVRNVIGGKVIIKKYAQLGANTIVMPNTVVNEGAVTGAMTFVNKDLDPWTINVGIPARVLKKRSNRLLRFLDKSAN